MQNNILYNDLTLMKKYGMILIFMDDQIELIVQFYSSISYDCLNSLLGTDFTHSKQNYLSKHF